MNDEYINKLIHDMLFETNTTSNPVSSYGSIDLDELDKTIKRLKKVPDINELIKENNKLQSNWNSLREWLKENEDKINYMEDVIDKMNELEGVNNENN